MSESNLQALRQAPAPRESTMPAIQAGFFNLQGFELIQRVSKAFSESALVPSQYHKNLPNCMIAIDMAQRIGANPLMVMQNLYIVHGTPSWSSKFLVATINACGRYSSLRYEWKGEPGTPEYGCRAWAIELSSKERLDGIWVTWEMVRAEGWSSKNGSKWKTMPDQMFIYRAAAFWQRAYAPELGMGLQTAEEVGDTFDAEADGYGGYRVTADSLRDVTGTVDAKTINPIPEAEAEEPKKSKPKAAKPEPKQEQLPPATDGPTVDDALALVRKGDIDGAMDLASSFSQADHDAVHRAIAAHSKTQQHEAGDDNQARLLE